MRIDSVVLASVLLLACDGDSPTASESPSLAMETLAKVSSSGFSERERTAVRDPQEWERAWQTLYANQNPVPPLPPVDFDREVVLLAAAGTRPNGCYSIDITEVVLTRGGALLADVRETVPGPTCVCTQALVQPVHVVKVGRLSEAEGWRERQRTLSC